MIKIKKCMSLVGFLVISLLFPFLALYADANIHGKVSKVTDSTMIDPVPRIKILLLDPSSHEFIQETHTDANGVYEFIDIPSGKYCVKVETDHFLAVSINPIDVQIKDHSIKANFSLGLPGGVEGVVTDYETGLPLSHATVEILRGNNVIASDKTDAHGEYRFNHISPRPHIIRVKKENFQPAMQLAVLIPNDVLKVDFNLKQPPSRLNGHVFNGVTGEVIRNASIDILEKHNGSTIESVQANNEGLFGMELHRGVYVVKISVENFMTTFQEIEILFDEPQKVVEFAIYPLGLLEGRVTHKFTKKPIVGASVGMWQNDALFASTVTDENGHYTLPGLGRSQIVVQQPLFDDKEKTANVSSDQTAILNFTLLLKAPTPPRRVMVGVSLENCDHRLNRIHTIKWIGSTHPDVVKYYIYRNGELIAKVPSKETLVYIDNWRKDKDKYKIVSVNKFGQESEPRRQEPVKK